MQKALKLAMCFFPAFNTNAALDLLTELTIGICCNLLD